MITLEDIIEELDGDIQDEFDLLPTHAVAVESGWFVGGGISLDRRRKQTKLDLAADLPADGARNVTEWIAGHLGQPARSGDIIGRDSMRVLVRKVRRQQVQNAEITFEASLPTSPIVGR